MDAHHGGLRCSLRRSGRLHGDGLIVHVGPFPETARPSPNRLFVLLLFVVFTALIPLTGFAQQISFALSQTFENPEPDADESFGWAVAIDGNNVLIGAAGGGRPTPVAGEAYLFDANTGQLIQTFENPNPVIGDKFGHSVAIAGNNVLIGETRSEVGAVAGEAYLFNARTGQLVRTFVNPDPDVGSRDGFGYSVAMDGTNVLVGAPWDDTGAGEAGVAYLFNASTGQLIHTFLNPSPDANDQFGYSVAIGGRNVVIGALNDDSLATGGSAYLFDANTGSQLGGFRNPIPGTFQDFGASVAVDGSNVVIGAPRAVVESISAGAGYLYDANARQLLQTFANPAPDSSDRFGDSVAIAGSNVVIGAWWDDTEATDAGAAYLFDASTGQLIQGFQSPSAGNVNYFASSVAIQGSNVVIGERNNDRGASNAGVAYLFAVDTSAPIWPEEGSLTASDIGPTSLVLQWTAATDNAAVVTYKIHRDGTLLETVGGDVLTYTVRDLSSATPYAFRIEACDAANNCTQGTSTTLETLAEETTIPPTTTEVPGETDARTTLQTTPPVGDIDRGDGSNNTPIIVAIIAALGTVVAAYFGYLGVRARRRSD